MALLRPLLVVTMSLAAACSSDSSGPDGGAGTVPHTYIRADTHTRLVFEVDSVEGVAPRTEAMDYVVDRVGSVVDKPDGIEFVADATIESKGDDHVWTFEELQQLAKGTFDMSVDDDTVKIHVVYLDGSYEGDVDGGATLGVAWKNRHLAMFADSLDRACDRPLLADRLCPVAESSVLLHEVGHVLGLVNNGIEMVDGHEDAEHRAHDESDDCVMYWAYEGAGITDVLASRLTGDSPALDFDEACRADLAAVSEE